MATVSLPKRTITAEEFLAMDLGEGSHELVRGEIVEVTPPKRPHGRTCANITYHLEGYGRESGYGYTLSNDTGLITRRMPDTVRGADVIFFSHARLPLSALADESRQDAPDLVVEVVSPGNRAAEILEKVREYLAFGVLMVWVVHPARRTVAVYRPDDPIPAVYKDVDIIENLPELPGFRCAVADFFI
ncbi:MAG TPA: Uma2 family endonuclease [Isosphaeraceae bacterium]|jgi:Uma2 family endonuclease|nr:Uma2 family endonuclease [Isosphaeraceae bacterium]